MPDPQPPSTIFSDSRPGVSTGTNEAMPRFGGRVDPGQTVHMSVDGNETTIAPTPGGGVWEHTVKELDNGEHEFEMWTEDAHGNRSDSIEWTNDVQSDATDRANQRARNDQWQRGGEGAKWLEENDRFAQGLTPPRPITGGGGGAPQPMPGDGPAAGGGGGDAGSQPRTPTGSGIGSDAAAGTPPTAAGLEKGNAGMVGHIG